MPTRPRIVLAFVAAVVALALLACKNTPSNVCKRFVALEVKKLAKYDPNAVTSDMKETEEKNCVEKMEAMKKDAPKQYECNAACVNDVKDLDDLEQCVRRCPKDE